MSTCIYIISMEFLLLIRVTEVPPSKTSQATKSKEKQLFLQANSLPTNFSYPQQLEILAKALPHVNDFLVCVRKHFQN